MKRAEHPGQIQTAQGFEYGSSTARTPWSPMTAKATLPPDIQQQQGAAACNETDEH